MFSEHELVFSVPHASLNCDRKMNVKYELPLYRDYIEIATIHCDTLNIYCLIMLNSIYLYFIFNCYENTFSFFYNKFCKII